MNQEFKFKIGDLVNVHSGWELPIAEAVTVTNRRGFWQMRNAGMVYVKEYQTLQDGVRFVHEEEDLKPYGQNAEA